jgi:hypothetical protein
MIIHEHGFNERELRFGKRHVCDCERRAAYTSGCERAILIRVAQRLTRMATWCYAYGLGPAMSATVAKMSVDGLSSDGSVLFSYVDWVRFGAAADNSVFILRAFNLASQARNHHPLSPFRDSLAPNNIL